MDRRTTLAMILCFLIFFGWQKLYLEPRLPKNAPRTAQTVQATSNQSQAIEPTQKSVSGAKSGSKAQAPVQTRPIQLSAGSAIVTNQNVLFRDWTLKGYRLGIAPQAASVDLQSVTHSDGELELSFDKPEYSFLSEARAPLKEVPGGATWTVDSDLVEVTRTVTASESQPYADVRIHARFKKQPPAYAFVSLTAQAPNDDPEARDRNLVYWTNQSIERSSLKDLKALKEVLTPVKWIGTSSRYFLMTLVNEDGTEPQALIQPLGVKHARISLVYPVHGNSLDISLRAFFGPKELDVLRAVAPTLDHTVDFGWFTLFAYPLLRVMKWLYGIFRNYGVAIILLTLLVKLVTYPLTYKSMKNMKEMAKVQPQLQRLREKYKDDKEALNREMMTLMRSHGYNPMAGCLPMLIQMPIFFALYRVLYSSIELYQAPFAFWIHDLASKDPYYVTPVLLSVVMFIQQKVTPSTAADPAQQKMMQFMPIMFGAFMISLPAGLTLYMLVNAIASIFQQLFLNKKLDTGHARAIAARAR